MPLYTDQLHRTLEISQTPARIVSLVPSQTELLYFLGLEAEVVGITKFCVHPDAWFRNKTRVGGTKTVKADVVKALRPDLIIANKEENVAAQVEALEAIAPVWVSDIATIEDALAMIAGIGAITGKTKSADALVTQLRTDIETLQQWSANRPRPRTAYLIWKDPYMAAGGDTFISDVMRLAGMENVLSHKPRYPSVTVAQLASLGTELLLLSSEPYPFDERHAAELARQLPGVKVITVDGEMFSWYGSRMTHLKDYLVNHWAPALLKS